MDEQIDFNKNKCSSNFIISLVREQCMRELTVIKRH